MLFFILLWKGIPEPDKLVTEFSQVFLHRKAAFLKNAISLFDYFIDQIPRGKHDIDRNPGLLRSPDKGFPEEAETIPDTVVVNKSGLIQVRRNTICFNTEKILQDLRVFAFTEHVMVMSIGIHFFKFGRDNTTGPENDNMIA
jgi:hypothetical protein